MALEREVSINRIGQNRRCSGSSYRKIMPQNQDTQNKTLKETNSEGWFVESRRNDKTKQILKSGGIKPL